MRRLIWWIRRDLRLEDNTALAAALSEADQVIPVFVLDERLLLSSRVQGGPRVAWMLDGLRALDADLRQAGSALIVRRGKPTVELLTLCQSVKAHGVYFNRDYSNYAIARDRTVVDLLESAGITVKSFKDAVIHDNTEIVSKQGSGYAVYAPFRKSWLALPKPDSFGRDLNWDRLRLSQHIDSVPIPSASELNSVPAISPIGLAGEQAARQRLATFAEGPIFDYAEQRNRPDVDGTAILSPYLHWGMISPRQCYWAAVKALESAPDENERRSVETWISELVWREFFYQLLVNNPASVTQNFRRRYDGVIWENHEDWLSAWTEGRTGYPIVDAAIHQMNTTGWMHNRVRMIVASFLCKDLLIDWRLGEAVFMRRLIDGDVANNVGNWQWVAGTGADAAPYFRIFNPTTQGQKFDQEGVYIRKWLPALANVPAAFIHAPHKMNAKQQTRAGCILGHDYPYPIVEHSVQRRRALAMYSGATIN